MSSAQFSMEEELEALHKEIQYFESQPIRLNQLSLIKSRVHEIVNNKYSQITQIEVTNLSDCFDQIQQLTQELQQIYQNEEDLQNKLQDIDQDLDNFFSNKLELLQQSSKYAALYEEYEVLKQQMSNNDPQKLYEEYPQVLLQVSIDYIQKYNTNIKELLTFAIYKNDIIELQKMKERFEFLLGEDNYMKYQSMMKPSVQSTTLTNQQIVKSYIEMIQKCIDVNVEQSQLKISIENPQEIVNIQDYKLVIFLLKVDATYMLIYLNSQLKTIQPICISQHRQQSKQFLFQFQETTSDFKTKYMLLKEQDLLKTIYQTFVNILIDDAQILKMQEQYSYEEMLERMKQYIEYQEKLEQLDCFEFMDQMRIELTSDNS